MIDYECLHEFYGRLEAGGGSGEISEYDVGMLAGFDCPNLASEGEKEALEWARRYAERYPPKETDFAPYDPGTPTNPRGPPDGGRRLIFTYLATKGDERDIEVINQLPNTGLGRLLEMRVAGKNVVGDNPSYIQFTPSVANTGPQAVYVREILYRYWEMAGRDSSKIPQELLTMVVSFDKDGNPVCSVDLAKYGLSMPVITPKPDKRMFSLTLIEFPWEDPVLTVDFPDLAEPVEITAAYMDRNAPDWKGLYIHVPKKSPTPDIAIKARQPVREKTPPPPKQPEEEPQASPKGKPILWLAAFALAFVSAVTVWRRIKREDRKKEKSGPLSETDKDTAEP